MAILRAKREDRLQGKALEGGSHGELVPKVEGDTSRQREYI